jgi:hypothetical protein
MTKDELQRMYDDAGSAAALGRALGVSDQVARYRLRKAGIEVRRQGYKSDRKVTYRGEQHTAWKGGTYRHGEGYIYEYAPDHPAAKNAKGYVLQHRLVMEQKLGRLLEPGEIVHHLNEVKNDNRPENLEIHTRSGHAVHHKTDALRDALGRFS